jgi:hypothetical protein
MAATAFPEHERRAAVEHARRLMVEDGYSATRAAESVAEDLGSTGRTVMRWAEAQGIGLGELSRDIHKTRAATEATIYYGQERRLELSNQLFARVKSMTDGVKAANEMKDLATAFAILTDKRRLEEGKSTERHEVAVVDARERLLNEVAERRARLHAVPLPEGRGA